MLYKKSFRRIQSAETFQFSNMKIYKQQYEIF